MDEDIWKEAKEIEEKKKEITKLGKELKEYLDDFKKTHENVTECMTDSFHNLFAGGKHICLYTDSSKEERIMSAIWFMIKEKDGVTVGTYGCEEGLIEMMGLLTPEETEEYGVVRGHLTADDIMARVKKYMEEKYKS